MCGISVVVPLKRAALPGNRGNGSNGNEINGVNGVHGAHSIHGVNGINGVNGTKGNSASLEKRLSSSLDLIAHRGPDAQGIWTDPTKTLGLGHCRLSIIDLSPDGVQPLHDDEGHIHAVVNGEIYDNERLREQCIREFGYKFRGHSDSETVVALYKHYGAPAFLECMRGEFSLVIYDDRTGQVFAARDRFGIKPLFWTVVGHELLIAAEMKAFLALGWRPEWNTRAVATDACFQGDTTIFRNVQKVRPGYYMTVSREGVITHDPYWELRYPEKTMVETRTTEEMIAQVREKMLEAVRLRLRADVPVGIYLSGGLDSSAVAGVTKHLVETEGVHMGSRKASERIACFCIQFDKESGFDESDIAARTAEHLGVQMHTIDMNEAALAQHFEDSTWHNEQHTFDLNTVGKFALSQLPRERGFKVILSGEGADEVFAGYSWFVPDYLLEPDGAMPESPLNKDLMLYERFRDTALADTQAMLGNLGAASKASDFGLAPEIQEQLNHTQGAQLLSRAIGREIFDARLQKIASPNQRAAEMVQRYWSDTARDKVKNSWHPLHASMYTWCQKELANFILTILGDRTEMAHSIEGRPPFLDHELFELVANMPPSVKLYYESGGESLDSGSSIWWDKTIDTVHSRFREKWILREAAKPFLTDEVYRRRKHPYTAPVVYAKGGPLHQLFARLLTKENADAVGFLNWPVLEESLDAGFGENADRVAFRRCVTAGCLVTIGRKFGVARAELD